MGVVLTAVGIFSEFKDTGNKYKMRIRSRVANLGDAKNPDLRRGVISGEITPVQISTMTAEVGERGYFCPYLHIQYISLSDHTHLLMFTHLLTLPHFQQMASDSLKSLRQKMTTEAIRDAQMSAGGGTKSDLLKCSKCKKRNCSYTQVMWEL